MAKTVTRFYLDVEYNSALLSGDAIKSALRRYLNLTAADRATYALPGEVVLGDLEDYTPPTELVGALVDVSEAGRQLGRKTAFRVEHSENRDLDIYLDGYGTADMSPGYGPVVHIENYGDGVPVVRVYSDIQQEEPAHRISLFHAQEKHRKPE
jgi:hypothetical protein